MAVTTGAPAVGVPARPGALAWLVLAWALVTFGVAAWWMRVFVVDDAFITLRYARHLASGLGPVWNAGAHDEGYTSPLWMALLALPHLLHVDAVRSAQWLGVAATLATAWTLLGWGAPPGSRASVAGAAAAALWLALPTTAVHAISGMETALDGLALTLLFRLADEAIERPGRAFVWLPLAMAFAGFTRPENQLASAIVLGMVAAATPRAARRGLLARAALLWIAPAAAHELARWAYYGLPAPLPAYLKIGPPGAFRGLDPVGRWLVWLAWPLGPAIVAGALPLRRGLRPAVAAALALTVFFTTVHHLMGYHFRFLAPLAPIACVLAAGGVARAARALAARLPALRPALACALVTLAIAALSAAGTPAAIADRVAYATDLGRAHVRLGRELAALDVSNVRLAISDAGAVPYESDWPAVDLFGLNDAAIARTQDRSPAVVFGRGVNALVLVSREPGRFQPFAWNAYETPLMETATRLGWRLVARREFAVDYWLWVVAPPGSPLERLPPGP